MSTLRAWVRDIVSVWKKENMEVVIDGHAFELPKDTSATDEKLVERLNEKTNSTPALKGITFSLDQEELHVRTPEKLDKNGNSIGVEMRIGMIEGTTKVIKGREVSIQDIDIETAEKAQESIGIIDQVLNKVDGERSHLGAVQNRMESTINNLSNIQENMTASKSRILDTDFASQTVAMASNQMLMQAGTTILSQARGLPQNAAMLLR